VTTVYWVVAALLALFYLYAGGLKLVRRREQLQPVMGWVDIVPMAGVRAVGAVEVVDAVGLILPALTGIAPGLALAAAAGFAVLQLLAGALHLARRETQDLWLTGVLLLLAGLAAWLWMASWETPGKQVVSDLGRSCRVGRIGGCKDGLICSSTGVLAHRSHVERYCTAWGVDEAYDTVVEVVSGSSWLAELTAAAQPVRLGVRSGWLLRRGGPGRWPRGGKVRCRHTSSVCDQAGNLDPVGVGRPPGDHRVPGRVRPRGFVGRARGCARALSG
jgi:hypothetical protein